MIRVRSSNDGMRGHWTDGPMPSSCSISCSTVPERGISYWNILGERAILVWEGDLLLLSLFLEVVRSGVRPAA